MASFVSDLNVTSEKKNRLSDIISKRFRNKNIHAFVNINEGQKIPFEMRQMMKYYGLGPLKPNTVIFGGVKSGSEAEEFSETIKCALSRSYNVIIVNDEKESIASSEQHANRDIHVWWDDDDQDTSELMLVLAYMMQRNPLRKRCRICLKAIVRDERARRGKINHFEELSLKLRLPLDIEVYVSPEQDYVVIPFVKTFSAEADIVMMALKKPEHAVAEQTSYIDYLNGLSKTTEVNPNIVLVSSSEHTPLESILR